MRFGAPNRDSQFQSAMDQIVAKVEFKDAFPHLDCITIVGVCQISHEDRIELFIDGLKQHKLTLIKSKTVFFVPKSSISGFRIVNWKISPDPD